MGYLAEHMVQSLQRIFVSGAPHNFVPSACALTFCSLLVVRKSRASLQIENHQHALRSACHHLHYSHGAIAMSARCMLVCQAGLIFSFPTHGVHHDA